MFCYFSTCQMNIIFTLFFSYLHLQLSYCSTKPFEKFEYKFSFKGPYLSQKDGSVPFWDHGGHAIPSDDYVRLTPSIRNKVGYIWSKNKINFDNFQIELVFRVYGRGRIGADGFAFWIVQDKQNNTGPVFGGPDKWNGLGIMFDTFDNDQQENNPIVMAVLNDKTKEFQHENDGLGMDIGHCLRDFRNRPLPIRARLIYFNQMLSIEINNGISDKAVDYEACVQNIKLQLPKESYIGITGATGDLADDHDILAVLTHSLSEKSEPNKINLDQSTNENNIIEKEYNDYENKLKNAKEAYKTEHNDTVKIHKDSMEESFENSILRQLWTEQVTINRNIKDIIEKLSVMDKNQNSLSDKVPNFSNFNVDFSTLKNDILVIKETISEIKSNNHGKDNSLFEISKLGTDSKNGINDLKDDIKTLLQKVDIIRHAQENNKVESSNLSLTVFIGVMLIQTVLIIVLIFKFNSHISAKKFY